MRVSHHVKRSVCLLLSLLLLAQGMTLGAAAVGTDSVPAGTSVLEPAAYPDSEVLVLYEDGRTEVVVYEDAASLEEGLPQLARQEGVALVQPNYTYTSTALSTTDPLLAEQWALYNDGSFQLEEQENPYPVFNDPFALPSAPWQWIAPWWMQSDASAGSTGTVQAAAGVDIGAEDAWALYDGGSRDVVVALVDTGIDYTHADLEGRIWVNEDEIPGNGVDDDGNGYIDDVYGWNFYSGSNQVYTGSEDSHGTHGAGTIAAHADNGIGIAGIVRSDHVKVMAVKALGGWDGSGSTASIIRAIQYAEANGARICNLSLGSSRNDPALYRTIAASDMLFVVAAGNDGADLELAPSYPASYHLDNLITVANLRYDGNLDPTSSYGASSVDLAAPRHPYFKHHPREFIQLHDRNLHGGAYGQCCGGHALLPVSGCHAGRREGHPAILRPKAGQPHRPDGYRRDAGPGCRHGIRGRGPEGADLDGAGPGGLYRQSAHSLPVSLPVEGAAVSDRSSPGSGRRLPLRRLCRRDIHGSEFPGRRRGDAPPLECVGGRHLAGAQWRTLYLLRGGPGRQ